MDKSSDNIGQARVAIIGGGAAGLASYRHVRAYPGIRATIFESSTSLGSLWSASNPYYRPELSTNVSRHTVAFSDFPWPTELVQKQDKSLFPYAADVGEYLQNYADKYVRHEDVRLGTKVESVHFQDKKWIVRTSSVERYTSDAEKEHFDYIILASGTFATPYIPSIPGVTESKIPTIHSANFPGPNLFNGKTAAVIGGSLSAVEIAGMLAPYAKTVHHIHKHPFYPLPRNASRGDTEGKGRPTFLPTDIVFNKRSTRETLEERTRPTVGVNRMFHSFLSSVCPPHPCPLDPDKPFRVGISDTYLPGVRSGVIQSHLAKLESINPDTGALRLSSGEEISSVDVIIFATGYSSLLPYISSADKAAIEYDEEDRAIPFLSHRLVLHPDLPQAGFVGLYRGPYFAISEMQAQYLAALIAGEKEWPSEQTMREGVDRERQIREYARNGKCQYPHDDYGGLVETYARLLDRPSPTTKAQVDPTVADQILPVNYGRQESEGVRALEDDMLRTLDWSKRGVWVLRAVFWSWGGRWRVKRVTRNQASGATVATFDGIACFQSRPPSALPIEKTEEEEVKDTERGVLEYLYYEIGSFTQAAGVSSPASQKYIYRYDPITDEISVWLVKEGSSGKEEIDKLFHVIFLSGIESDAGSRFKDHQVQGGWLASGNTRLSEEGEKHTAFYKFCFERGEVQQFGIGYDVGRMLGKDPSYTSEAWYERDGETHGSSSQ
ncbi:FAD/NAD(P)-binding domain-containing protein [Heliocybe sulcata]|uniref:FAD/NAD(P)-binding domain-containing protein n=1 Tax=Heliocybe sulcata TaxID=5364 RepID=A0A5C3NCJ0_9AGAM|nr:FAD/NAD(P)-binding domain-containing protein [Heliocybe sulcata]